MTDDPDVFKVAELLIRQDGEGASDTARRRAGLLLSRQDHIGFRTWTEIADAIDELQRQRNPDESVN